MNENFSALNSEIKRIAVLRAVLKDPNMLTEITVDGVSERFDRAQASVKLKDLEAQESRLVGAKSSPMRKWPRREGRSFGWHLLDEKTKGSALRSILSDVNYWKTRVHESLALASGESGSLSLYGTEKTRHRMISEHVAAEVAKLVEVGANKVVEWSPNVNRPDNHYFDCVVGNYVAASTLGLLTSDDPRRRV